MAEWKQIQCYDCGGYGQVSAYTADGSDFLGAEECKTCNGSGTLSQTSKVIAQWPGGPFVGRVEDGPAL